MKQIIKILIFITLSLNMLFGLSSQKMAESINSAGKGRMLIQKMTKEALLIKLNLDREKNIENLRKSSEEFDNIFSNLPTLDKKDVERELKVVNGLWDKFYKNIKNITENGADKKSFEFLEKNNMRLVREIDKLVKLYVKENGEKESKLTLANDINLAGKQRMLTQRMAKDLLAIKNGFNRKKNILKTLKSLKDYLKKP